MIHLDTKLQPPPQLPVVFAAITGARSREWETNYGTAMGAFKKTVWGLSLQHDENAVGGLGQPFGGWARWGAQD